MRHSSVDLLPPVRLLQAEVHADQVQLGLAPGRRQHAVQQAALLVPPPTRRRGFVAQDRKLRQHRIAMVPVGYTALRP
jgi:hypothetical protein